MKTPEQIRMKEKELLKYLHNEVHSLCRENDPFDDKSLIDQEVTRYHFFAKNIAKRDPAFRKGERFSYMVKTKIYGGRKKHVDMYEWKRLEKQYS